MPGGCKILDEALGLDPGPLLVVGADGALAERIGERRPVTFVFGTIQRKHAGPHHLGCRKAGVVDGEGLDVTHDVEGERTAGYQPAPEGRQP